MRDGRPSPEVSGDFAEFRHGLPRFGRIAFNSMGQTVIDVVVDQGLLGRSHSLFDRMKLLSQIQARPARLDHDDRLAQMSLGALQPIDDFRMGFVGDMRLDRCMLSPWRG